MNKKIPALLLAGVLTVMLLVAGVSYAASANIKFLPIVGKVDNGTEPPFGGTYEPPCLPNPYPPPDCITPTPSNPYPPPPITETPQPAVYDFYLPLLLDIH